MALLKQISQTFKAKSGVVGTCASLRLVRDRSNSVLPLVPAGPCPIWPPTPQSSSNWS
jgi:hypothetical protein